MIAQLSSPKKESVNQKKYSEMIVISLVRAYDLSFITGELKASIRKYSMSIFIGNSLPYFG